jgi:hypothetical protein
MGEHPRSCQINANQRRFLIYAELAENAKGNIMRMQPTCVPAGTSRISLFPKGWQANRRKVRYFAATTAH